MSISLTDLRQAERECLARLAEKENKADRVVLFLVQSKYAELINELALSLLSLRVG